MRIAKITLHNVKSYAGPTTLELAVGINAICGQNGAGKSTILEALGFALFGYRPYKLDSFLRAGEKSGSVTVTVEDDEGCLFHVVRKLGSGSGYAVYDELNHRLAEGEADVRNWLLDFFHLERGTDLAKLFEDTVGPPQGTLTSIFLESAGPRSKKFDRLLGIDEYPAAVQYLRAVSNLFKEQAVEAERRAALLEGDARRLPEVEERQAELKGRMADLGIELARIQEEQAELAASRERWERAQQAVQRAVSELGVAESRVSEARRRQKEQAAELARAEEAARRVEVSREGYLLYLETAERLKQLNQQRQERDRLRQSAEFAVRAALKAEQEMMAAEQRLAELAGEEARAAELELLIPEQERRESALRQVEERVRSYQEALRQLPLIEERISIARGRLAEAQERLAEIEAARPVAVGLEPLREQDRELRQQLTRLEQQGWALKQALDDLADARGRLRQLSAEIEQLRSEIQRLSPLVSVAARAQKLQEKRDSLFGSVQSLQARYEEAERSRSQVGDGLCPFLKESCRNLREGVSLDAYFEAMMADTSAELERARGDLERVEMELAKARNAERSVARLPDLERRLQSLSEEKSRLEGEISRLERQQADLAETPAEITRIQEEIRGLEPSLVEAERSWQLLAGEAGWRSQAEEASQAVERERRALAEVKAILESEAGATDELAEKRSFLAELGDPRAQAAALRQQVARIRPEVERTLERSRRDAVGARAAEDRARQALEPFAQLEEEMAAATRLRDENEIPYRDFLANQAEAERLRQRREAKLKADQEMEQAESALQNARLGLEALQAAYDEAEHRRILKAVEDVAGRAAGCRRELELCRSEEKRNLQEIEKLRRSKAEMESALGEAVECRQLVEAVEAIRRALDAAGPEMARVMLRRISDRATGIYRDLLGQPTVSIEWSSDYEIRCRIRSEEREFKQLSGGEQMAAALAVRLALLQTLSNLRLAFLDEPTAHMDALRRANLATQIQNLKSFDQLVVISHDDSFDNLHGHVVRLVKRDGETVIED